ncbi:PREDICTED: melanoma-associated antigen B2-like [Dipodomys ordii]|uniref:Melanoma-associated antigen B2-like n=1 Tax=Dipodomys ordii TaxID=10020 RepID=A0A1S3FZF3_DIPOR|nr:PREDICTED: melanoma-associated antigen B2-like [Dipodomys ordii]
MPRGLGSKLRAAQDKRYHETQDSHQSTDEPHATRADKKESTYCPGGGSRDIIPSTSAKDSPKRKNGAPPTISKAPHTTTSKVPVTATTKAPVTTTTAKSPGAVTAATTTKAPVATAITTKAPVVSTTKTPVATTTKAPVASTSRMPPLATSKAPLANTSKATAADSLKKSSKSANPRGAQAAHPARAPPFTEHPWKDLILRKAGMLMQYLLYKYKTKQPIVRGEMMKIINRRFKDHFPEILQKASERMDLIFGLELKEIKPNSPCYTLVSKAEFTSSGGMPSGLEFPKNGLLMSLLGVIFLNGNCATEEEVWEFLSILGVYDGRKHIIFGEPRKLITRDMVKEKYLEYQQVPGSDPPRYQFLWGPRAHAETSKMQVLEFLAKVNDTIPSDFPGHYEEALREEEEQARAQVSSKAQVSAKDPDVPGTSSHQQ